MTLDKRTIRFWENKSLFITGATSGLGYAVVEALSHLPVTIGVFSRNKEKMAEMESRFSGSAMRFWWRAGDVRNREEVENAVQDFAAFAGKLDVIWANSGISLDTRQVKWDWEAYHAIIETNLHGAVYTIHAGLQAMGGPAGAQGHVVAIGSAASMRGLPGRGLYSLTKISLAYYLESLVAEFPGVSFHIIHPGFVDTPINQGNPNRFWLLHPPKAARLMLRAVARGKSRYIYPWQMKVLYHLVHCLPEPLYFWIAKKVGKISIPRGERQDPQRLLTTDSASGGEAKK